MTFKYFSETERGATPRTAETVSPATWGGIAALINSLVNSGAFGVDYPATCPDGSDVTGTHERTFQLALRAEVPGIEWPLQTDVVEGESWSRERIPWAPDTLAILDLVQFCYQHVAEPIQGKHHSYFNHHHLSFNRDSGRAEFLKNINRIFARNGLAYELKRDGSIIRIAPPVLAELVNSPLPSAGERTLDEMLEDARQKFLSADPKIRRESLERLWDAWERLKSLADTDKKRSVAILLDKAATEPSLRQVLEQEAKALTDLGNTFMIRHSEVSRTPISESIHIDYLFHRLFALIHLLLRTK